MSHDYPLDDLELGRRVAARIGNENREQWGAWVTPNIFWISYARVDAQLAQADARNTPARIPAQRRPSD